MSFRIDPASDYQRDGVVCVRGLLDREWVDRLRVAAELHLANLSDHLHFVWAGAAPGGGREFTYMSRRIEEFRRLAMQSPAPRLAAFLMDCVTIRFWFDHLLPKDVVGKGTPPEASGITRKGTYWHSDLPVWPLRGQQVVSVWIALSRVDVSSSGIQYIAGSQAWGLYRAREHGREIGRREYPVMPDIDSMVAARALKVLTWDMEPGDCLCHQPLVIHGSSPNRGPERRLAIALRYLGDDVTWDPSEDVIGVPTPPNLSPGAAANDDAVFPVAWTRQA